MPTYSSLAPFNTTDWTLAATAPDSLPTIANGVLTCTHPASPADGGSQSATCSFLFDAPNVGDRLFNYALTWSGTDKTQAYFHVTFSDGKKLELKFFNGSYFLSYNGTYVTDSPMPTPTPTGVRATQTSTGVQFEVYTTAWINAVAWAGTPASWAGMKLDLYTEQSYNPGALSGGTVTFQVMQDATVSGVTVTPGPSVSITGGTQQQFNASVQGSYSPPTTVVWTLTGAGSISTAGLYQAPAATGTTQSANVTATSTYDGTKSATVAVTIPAAPPSITSVAMSPAGPLTLAVGDNIQFTGTIVSAYGAATTGTWSTSDATVGIIDSTGRMEVVGRGPLTVTYTSTFDTTKKAMCGVTIAAANGTADYTAIAQAMGTTLIALIERDSGMLRLMLTVMQAAFAPNQLVTPNQVGDAVKARTFDVVPGELTSMPSINSATFYDMQRALYHMLRNKETTTAGSSILYRADGVTPLSTAPLAQDANGFYKGAHQ